MEEISNFRRGLPQFCIVGVKNVILLGWGLILGYPTVLLPALQNDKNGNSTTYFELNEEAMSWIASINLLCVPLGSVTSGLLMDPIGKRRLMQILNLPMLCSWALFYFATNITQVYIGLGLSGISGGLLEAPLLIYIAETVEPRYRGMLTASGTATVLAGVCLQFIIGTVLHWKTVAMVSAVIPFLAFNAVFLVPESPYWLYKRNRIEDARKSLQWLRGWVPFDNVKSEFEQITYSVEELIAEKNPQSLKDVKFTDSLVPFAKRSFIAPFLLILFGFVSSHFSGMTPLQTYATPILESYHVPINEHYATILLGAAQVLGCLVGMVFVRSIGKRRLVFISMAGCSACFMIVGTYSYMSGNRIQSITPLETSQCSNYLQTEQNLTITSHPNANTSTIPNQNDKEMEHSWLPLILLLGGSLFAHMGAKMFPWMLIGEVYPIEIRNQCAGISSAMGYLIGFLSNKLFPKMVDTFTLDGTFWFFSGVATIGCIVLYFILPETENKTLQEIEAYFDKKKRNAIEMNDTSSNVAHITRIDTLT